MKFFSLSMSSHIEIGFGYEFLNTTLGSLDKSIGIDLQFICKHHYVITSNFLGVSTKAFLFKLINFIVLCISTMCYRDVCLCCQYITFVSFSFFVWNYFLWKSKRTVNVKFVTHVNRERLS